MKNFEKNTEALSTPLKNNSLVLLVVERIKESIINKELKPGDYLPPENTLSRNLGVGKSSVREAIKMLQAMGVVEIRRGTGVRILEKMGEDILNPLVFHLIMAQSSIEDIVELRKVFEPDSTIMAMKNATEEDVAEIQGCIDYFEEAISKGVQKADDDIRFHIAILKATHNPLIIKIGETILHLFTASIERSMEDIPQVALKDHKNIFKAFLSKDEKYLRKAEIDSFNGWHSSLEKMRKNDSGESNE